jgi:hypothetical protein
VRTTDQILASVYDGDGGGAPWPERLCHDCTEALGLTGTVMSLMSDEDLSATVGSSGPVVSRLEELQFELGEGPAVDAAREAVPCAHSDLGRGAETRWPVFAPVAMDAGIRSVLALPLQVGAVQLGGLGLYSDTPGRLSHGETASTAPAYAEAAVVVLLELQAQAPPGDGLPPDLASWLGYRAEVHQATGFVSVRASVTLGEALALLRARSYASGRPLPEVAREVLAERMHIQDGRGNDE